MTKLVDKNEMPIEKGMSLLHDGGSVERVELIEDGWGGETLGINASNENYLLIHDTFREYYPLTSFVGRYIDRMEDEKEVVTDYQVVELSPAIWDTAEVMTDEGDKYIPAGKAKIMTIEKLDVVNMVMHCAVLYPGDNRTTERIVKCEKFAYAKQPESVAVNE